MDTIRALTRDQVAVLWRLDIGLRDKTLWRVEDVPIQSGVPQW
ncbi:hypothetical protein AB0I61_32810 [Polymorphospora rubra]